MRKFAALILSLVLHVGLAALFLISFKPKTTPLEVSSVPVEILSTMPARQIAEAPVDELAVKEPAPIPEPEVPLAPPPKPEPIAPKLEPKPEVSKPKPDAKKNVPVDKEGLKKKQDDSFDLSRFSAPQAQASKAQTKKPASPTREKTQGASNTGNAPQDAGAALNLLTQKLQKLWNPNCDVPGARDVKARILFTISPTGRVIKGPEWANRRADPVWEAGASRAIQAVKRGELYTDLPDALYNRDLAIVFDASSACQA